MIPYNVCMAIRDLIFEMVQVRKYVKSLSHLEYEYHENSTDDFVVDIYNSGNVEVCTLKPSYEFLISVDDSHCISSLYKGGSTSIGGSRYDFGDHTFVDYDRFAVYSTDTDSTGTADLCLVGEPSTEDDYESAFFQLSTLYSTEDAGIMLLYNYIRPIIQGTLAKVYSTEHLYKLTYADVHDMLKLVQSEFLAIKESVGDDS